MRRLLMACLIFFYVTASFTAPLNNIQLGFNIKKANQEFDHINLQLSVQNLNLTNLETAVETLSDLSDKADECVEDVQKKINNIEILIKQGSNNQDEKKEGADRVYLDKQHKELADEQAQCRLFSIRAREAIEAYKNASAELKQEEALTRGMPLWGIMRQAADSPPETNLTSLITQKLPGTLPTALTWLIILCVAVISSTTILFRVQQSRFSKLYLRFKKIRIQSIVLLATFFISAMLFIHQLTLYEDGMPFTLPLRLSSIVLLFMSGLILTSFLFKFKKIRACFHLYFLDIAYFRAIIIASLCFYTVAIIGQLFASSFNPNSPLWQLCQSLYLLIILSTGGHFILKFCTQHRHIAFIKHHYHFIQRSTALLLFSCALIGIFGYHTLANHLALSGFTTAVIIFVTLLINQSIKKLYLGLTQHKTFNARIIKYFGYRADQTFTEFLILRTVAQILVVSISIYLIGRSWGFATDYIESIYDRLLYGIHIANVTVYPTRIISGLVVFCVLYLVFRAISTSISSHQQFEDEEETQVAVASILTYIGFGLALISGFLVAGFDFTGLAIIAGALSVGIGLGLQSIVNNFVSGLILLIEKPIRPGDRINVDGIEGFVKKIRVRSTQIITPSREDIIVPNSDLITRRVTNYMFSDKYCRINCEVGVAYGSDTQLVHDVLLNVANEHDEVIKTGRNKPVVLLRSFGDSNLVFQLWCLIKDVNKKFIVRSELNFAIDKAFREHHICMAFPQRDVNIKITDLEYTKKESDEIISSQ